MSDNTLSTSEAAARLDLTADTVRRRCQRGTIEARKGDAGQWQIPPAEVERIRDQRWQKYGDVERRIHPT